VGSTGVATTFCLKRILHKVLSSATYSPSPRQAGAPTINIQSTLHIAADLCKNVSLAVLIDSNDNSYSVSTQSDVCVCVYTYCSQYRDAGRTKEIIKLGEQQ
jgi:hypothetical protein